MLNPSRTMKRSALIDSSSYALLPPLSARPGWMDASRAFIAAADSWIDGCSIRASRLVAADEVPPATRRHSPDCLAMLGRPFSGLQL
ncbi:hypothetical protein MRX96_005993 [Rhipicephalus microplus]